ncbi:hypothetical protein G6F40_017006 [Rhizopus arrhizus]|uniref:Uncharacterized protein n=1 Tax=Rhizopus delemar TaxID=936053 RepID=A0A9P6XMQ2_9FUNG|nr:hypothetical protein G6F23_014693 [Rhizopus arrhizus]KAG1077676.1 hypothetical protein G6F40_017006 [Rhizopus arrhizus]KAG1526772.1 hypothetical protein G6F50_018361 [Rhizopus delemar]
MVAVMVNQMNPFRHAVHPLAVDRQRLVFPRVEQAQRDIHEFFGAGIAPVVSRHGFVAMVARLGVEHGSHHVPAHAAA